MTNIINNANSNANVYAELSRIRSEIAETLAQFEDSGFTPSAIAAAEARLQALEAEMLPLLDSINRFPAPTGLSNFNHRIH